MDLGVVGAKSPVAIFLQLDKKEFFTPFSIVCKNYFTTSPNGTFVAGNIVVYNVTENIYKVLLAIEDKDILTIEFEETIESIKRRDDRELIYLGGRLEG